MIRTSGEMRLSNFLLWQLAYAEIHVTPTLWPEFRGAHLLESIEEYQKRERRYGGLSGDSNHSSSTAPKRGAERLHLLKRVLTAVVLIPIVVVLVLRVHPIALVALITALVALLAVQEFLNLGRRLRHPALALADLYIFVGLFFSCWRSLRA